MRGPYRAKTQTLKAYYQGRGAGCALSRDRVTWGEHSKHFFTHGGGCHQRTKGLYRVKTQNTRERGWVCTIKKGSINITEIKGSIQDAHSKLPRILPDQIRLGRGDGCERVRSKGLSNRSWCP